MNLTRYAYNPKRGAYHYGRDVAGGMIGLLCGRTAQPGDIAPLALPQKHTECKRCGAARDEQTEAVTVEAAPAEQVIRDDELTLAEQAGVAYATVGRGKRVHFSPRNDETLCGRFISEYRDARAACTLLDNGHGLCVRCWRIAEQRAESARLAAASPLAAAAMELADTVETASAATEPNVDQRYSVEQFGNEYGVLDTYTVDWIIEQTDRDNAESTAARLNQEHAEARAAGPFVHRFYSTSEAYDATQCRDHIKDGDVLVIEREQVVGFLRSAWPGAVTAAHGELHTFTADPRAIDDGKYAASVDLAEQIARQLGAPLPDEQPTVEDKPASTVDESERADCTWRDGWVAGTPALRGDALFDLGPDEEQGALFA
jgi:hypothetical protein